MESGREKQSDREKFKREFKKRMYQFTLQLITFIENLPNDNVSRRLGEQLLRSGTSMMANYIEGQAGSSRKDFQNFFNIALKSGNESKLWISLLKDSGKTNPEKSEALIKELIELTNILAKSILTLKSGSTNAQRNNPKSKQ